MTLKFFSDKAINKQTVQFIPKNSYLTGCKSKPLTPKEFIFIGFISSSTVGRSKRGKKLEQQPKMFCKLLNFMSPPKLHFLIDTLSKMSLIISPVSHCKLACTKKEKNLL